MTITEITNRINNIASSWEEFKRLNDERLSKNYSFTDTATLETLQKINNNLDEQKERINMLETAAQRPNLNDMNNYKNDFEYDKSFIDYICKGYNSCSTNEKKSLNSADRESGGYLLPNNVSKIIDINLSSLSPMRKICSVEKISGDKLEHLSSDNTETFVGWRDEIAAVNTDTQAPKIKKTIININELYAQPQITKRLLDDAIIDVGKWLTERLVDSFRAAENKAFINGNGTGQPQGILSYSDGKNSINKIEIIKETALTSDSIIKLYYSLNDNFATNACFLMNRSTLQQVRLLKLTTGQYLWQPGLAEGSSDTLMGIPVYQANDMPMFADNKVIIALGDFKHGYKIVDNRDIRILRDPFTEKPYVKFYTTKRVGGAVVNGNAIKLLKVNKNGRAAPQQVTTQQEEAAVTED